MRPLTKSKPSYRRKCLLLGTALRVLLLGIVWRGTCMGPSAHAEPAAAPEYDVKAAFLFNFTQFVKWPPGPGGQFTIGILGDDPFGGALDKIIQGATVNGRKLAVKRSRKADDLKGCQVVFVPGGSGGNFAGALAALAGANILTVGEHDGFVKQGGTIGFVTEGEKVRFEINTGAAQRSGLEISSRLLKLAIRVGSW